MTEFLRTPDSNFDGLAELKLSAVSAGSLHLGAADGPALQLAALPYTVPLETA